MVAPIKFLWLLILLSGCSDCCSWITREFDTCAGPQKTTYLVPKNPFNGIEVRFFENDCTSICYLGVYCRQIPQAPEWPHFARVWIQTETETHFNYAYRMEGGQRLLLRSETTSYLKSKLEQCTPFTILLDGGYQAQL